MVKKAEQENWFIEAVKPTETERLILSILVDELREMVNKEIKRGMKAGDAAIKCAKEILKRKEESD